MEHDDVVNAEEQVSIQLQPAVAAELAGHILTITRQNRPVWIDLRLGQSTGLTRVRAGERIIVASETEPEEMT